MKKKTITLEEYEAEMRTHDLPPDEEILQSTLSVYGECIGLAEETGQAQQPIDVRTLAPIANVHPDGRIEFLDRAI